MTDPSLPPPVCNEWVAITYSQKRDTKETIDQIRVNNATHDAYCTPVG